MCCIEYYMQCNGRKADRGKINRPARRLYDCDRGKTQFKYTEVV
jgi:hypothetical protein